MNCCLKAGKTSLLKAAQCGQATEAYSITVTLAAGLPRLMSSAVTAEDFWPQAARASANAAIITKLNCERRMAFPCCGRAAPKGPVKRDSASRAHRPQFPV